MITTSGHLKMIKPWLSNRWPYALSTPATFCTLRAHRENVANYRPVTLLPAVDKIFEQLLCYQLRDKFETIFDNSMSAYRKRYSCETTVIRLVEENKEGMSSEILTKAHAMEYLPEWSVLCSSWQSFISLPRWPSIYYTHIKTLIRR